jgi:DNA repair protein RecO (recombination protein O)
MLTKDTAICIRATDFSETSQILTLFTRQAGKINAIAKGSKRPKSAFDGPIEVFSHGKIVFSDSNKEKLTTLTEFEQQPGFTDLAGNLFALNCASFAAELVNSLTDDYDPHPELFDSFLQFLQNINELRLTSHESRATSHELSLLILFQLSLLKEIGLQPILNHCANCKMHYEPRTMNYELYFSSSANGLICKDCEASFPDKIKLTNTAANCLSNLKLIAEADEKTLNEIERILIYHFTEILGRPPKMAKYVLKS